MEGVNIPSLNLEDNKISSIIKNRSPFTVKKTEYYREYKRLKLQEEFLDKSLTVTIQNLKIDADFIRRISEDRVKAFSQRQSEVQKLADSALRMVRELKTVRSMLQEAADPSAIQNLDLSDCRLRLTRLSSHIEDFKLDKSMESLIVEEDRLDSDLRDFERFVFTERSVPKSTSKFPYHRLSSSSELANDELTELLARTGHTKGWSSEDHSVFLRVRKKLDSVPQLVVELRRKLPHLTNEEIVNHEAWYKLYTELRDKRKRDIAEWRSKRVPSVKVTGPEDGPKTRLGNREKKESEKNIEKKKMIENWRAEKARKSAMDDEQRKELMRSKIDLEKRRVNDSRSALRARLEEFREERARERVKSEPIPRSELKPCDSRPRLIKAFREQDERYVRKRLSLLKMTDLGKFGAEDTRKSSATKPRECSTLFKGTKSWEEKSKAEDNPADSIFGRVNYVKDIQKLSSSAGLRKEDSSIMKNV